MAITLAEARNNVQNDYDPFVIDEFRKTSMLDLLPFDDIVNPSGGGGTLTAGYRRLNTQATAATRAINSEYTPQNVTTTKHTTDLAVMGGAFEVDRVVAQKLGQGDGAAIELNVAQKVKATGAKFTDLVVNGDTAVDANGFDGLKKILTGSSTEFADVVNWSDLDATTATAHKALDWLDEVLSSLDGAPTFALGNAAMLAKIRGLARRSGQYVREPIEGLLDRNGRPVMRESYGGLVFVDAGAKPGSNDLVIPTENRTVATVAQTGLTDLYFVRAELDGFHGITTVGSQLAALYLPDLAQPGAVKLGEVELGPVGVALKATKAAAVMRNVKIR